MDQVSPIVHTYTSVAERLGLVLPKEDNKTDLKIVAQWMLGTAAVFLFVYSFALEPSRKHLVNSLWGGAAKLQSMDRLTSRCLKIVLTTLGAGVVWLGSKWDQAARFENELAGFFFDKIRPLLFKKIEPQLSKERDIDKRMAMQQLLAVDFPQYQTIYIISSEAGLVGSRFVGYKTGDDVENTVRTYRQGDSSLKRQTFVANLHEIVSGT